MRKHILLYAAMLCSSFCMYAQEHPAAEVIVDTVTVKSISYPSYKIPEGEPKEKKSGKTGSPFDGLALTGVELRDTATVLAFECSCLPAPKSRRGNSCCIDSDCFLVTINDGVYTYFDFIGAEGIAIAPKKTKLKRGESVEFKLFFEPLPEGTGTFNLCELGGWDIGDIDLSTSNNPESQNVGTFNLKQYIVFPTFQGGDINRVSTWVSQRLVYPEDCRSAKMEETVMLELTVRKDGTISASLLKGCTQAFIDEALRVAAMLPPMTPGSVYGRNCVITYTFPVIFRLR